MRPAQSSKDRDGWERFRGVFIMHTSPTLLCREEYGPSCNTLCAVAKLTFPKHCGATSSVSPGHSGVYGISEKDLQYPIEWEQLRRCQVGAASLPLLENPVQ